jgi:hypothetical protein
VITEALESSGIESLTDVPRGLFEDRLTDCRASAACLVHAWAFAAASTFEGVAVVRFMMGTMAMISNVEMAHNMNQWAVRVAFDKVYNEEIEEHYRITRRR